MHMTLSFITRGGEGCLRSDTKTMTLSPHMDARTPRTRQERNPIYIFELILKVKRAQEE